MIRFNLWWTCPALGQPKLRSSFLPRQKACEEVVQECENLLSLRDLVGRCVFFFVFGTMTSDEISDLGIYHLVNIQKTMENHNFWWVNQLFLWPFSIAMFVCQRVLEMAWTMATMAVSSFQGYLQVSDWCDGHKSYVENGVIIKNQYKSGSVRDCNKGGPHSCKLL